MLACFLTVVIGVVTSEIANYFRIYETSQPVRTNSKKNNGTTAGIRLNDIVLKDSEMQSAEPFLRKPTSETYS